MYGAESFSTLESARVFDTIVLDCAAKYVEGGFNIVEAAVRFKKHHFAWTALQLRVQLSMVWHSYNTYAIVDMASWKSSKVFCLAGNAVGIIRFLLQGRIVFQHPHFTTATFQAAELDLKADTGGYGKK